MADTEGTGATEGERVVIKKYANRRLYNTASSSYVTLEHLADMVKKGVDFVVYDAKTNEDITRTVLTQIIFEEESQGQSLLPIQFLRQLIGFYGNSVQAFLPSYLELFSPFAYAKTTGDETAPPPKPEPAAPADDALVELRKRMEEMQAQIEKLAKR
jgi:polyhydroxyalkanoate synthesis repressor PhaR